jgi:hypothetical protein
MLNLKLNWHIGHLLISAICLAGCQTLKFVNPPGTQQAPTSVTDKFPVRIAFSGDEAVRNGFRVWITNPENIIQKPVDLTDQFSFEKSANGWIATGLLQVTPGNKILVAGACWGRVREVSLTGLEPSPGCKITRKYVAIAAPQISFSPLNPAQIELLAGGPLSGSINVSLRPPPMFDTNVTLNSPLTSATSMTVPARAPAPVPIPGLTALASGAGTLTADGGSVYGTATVPLIVRPALISVSPASAMPAATITVTGTAFTAPMLVSFTSPTTTTLTAATITSPTTATTEVPSLNGPEEVQLGVTSNGQTSPTTLPFNILAGPPPSRIMYRLSGDEIQIIRFTANSTGGGGTFVKLSSLLTTSGLATSTLIGAAASSRHLVRSGISGLDLFAVTGTPASPTLLPMGVAGGASSGTATSAIFGYGGIVRGKNNGLEFWNVQNPPLISRVSSYPGLAGYGDALAPDGTGTYIVRSTPTQLEIWNGSSASSGLTHSLLAGQAATGSISGVALISQARVVRSYASGIEIFTVTGLPIVRVGGNATGGASHGSVVYVSAVNLIARTTMDGIEIYDSPQSGDPVKCGHVRSGDPAVLAAPLKSWESFVFRATATSIESFDLAGLVCPASNSNQDIAVPATIFRPGSTTGGPGLGLAGAF